ncbi:hypothetical protein [Flavobacterium sp.]|uniref:hypothetical protein n=1 Tax=Flavobacterium sp. TaxID=239 RepID=UPI004047797F
MRKAIKSDKPLYALINKNFIIRALENPKGNPLKNTKLTSANKLSDYLHDEPLKIKFFNKVLGGGKDKYTFLIRSRLKVEFHAK